MRSPDEVRVSKEAAAVQTIEAVQAQRAAHDAYCRALEDKIACLEARYEKAGAAHMLAYTFLTDKRPDLVGEFVEHCLASDTPEEWARGRHMALDGLDEHSDVAEQWLRDNT